MTPTTTLDLRHGLQRAFTGVPDLLGFCSIQESAPGQRPDLEKPGPGTSPRRALARRLALPLLLAMLTAALILLSPLAAASQSPGDSSQSPGDSSQGAESGCPSVPPTPHFTIAYGTVHLDGQQAPVGAVVQALSPRAGTVGCFEVRTAGHYGAMFVFGEDTTADPPIEGMRPGEPIAFRVGSEAAEASPPLTWSHDSLFHNVSLAAGPGEVCYGLTTSASPSGGGTVDPDTEPNCTADPSKYAAGTQVELTANPAVGYTFDNWSGDASGSTNPTTVIMDQERSVTANFGQTCYTLATAASPSAGGSVVAGTSPNCAGDPGKYAAGTQVELTANPNPSYTFDDWSGDASGSTNPTTVTMDGDRSVTANFSQICYTLTTAASPSAGGLIDVDTAPNCTGDPAKYTTGTQVELTANPNTSYSFDNWSGDAGGSTNPTTVTMDQDHSVTANFSQTCYTLTTAASPSTGGSVLAGTAPNCTGDPSKYAAGTQVALTANPNPGYAFDDWSGDASGSANPTTVTMDQDRSVTANFQPCYSLTASVDPSGSGSVVTDPAPNCGSDPARYLAGTQVQLTANPAIGYILDQWAGDASGSANPITLTMDRERSVTAHFVEQCYRLTISIDPDGGGSVEADPLPNCSGDPTRYGSGSQVQLRASPTAGYRFHHWSGDVGGSDNPSTVAMNNDKTATGHFRKGYWAHLPLIQRNPRLPDRNESLEAPGQNLPTISEGMVEQ